MFTVHLFVFFQKYRIFADKKTNYSGFNFNALCVYFKSVSGRQGCH
jgi:hypothetical protein